MVELYQSEYRSLVRLAVLLGLGTAAAEEVVQEAFIAAHNAWPRLADIEAARSYLRRSVVIGCRSALRHSMIADRSAPIAGGDRPGVREIPDERALVAVLRALPVRQRELLVLRFYAGLSEAQIAQTMGISRAAVRVQTARAMTALRHSAERAD